MKKTLTFLAAACALALLPISNADADNGSSCRLTGYTPCGKPIYSYFHVHGYDNCGRPVGHWVQNYPTSCHCRSNSNCDSGHNHNVRRSSGVNFFFRF